MKKLIALVLTAFFVFTLASCKGNEQDKTTVYSFCGYGEDYVISNGTIVLSDYENIFYGGNLQAVQYENVENIASYTATFYLDVGEKQEIVYVDELLNNSSFELLNIDFGKTISDNAEIYDLFNEFYNSNGSFCCELKTTDTDGNIHSDSIVLELTKITE